MKKNYLLGLLPAIVVLLFLSSCDGDKKGVEINVPYYMTQVLTVDTTSQIGHHELTELVIPSKLDSVLEANNAKRSDVSNVVISSLKFQPVDSQGKALAGENFDAIESMQTLIHSPAYPTSTLIAYKNNIPDGLNVLQLSINNDVQFKKYLEDSQLTLKATFDNSAPITQKRYVRVSVIFTITANI